MIIVCVLCCTSHAASAVGGKGLCWSLLFSKLAPNLLLKVYQSLKILPRNLSTSSKSNKLANPYCHGCAAIFQDQKTLVQRDTKTKPLFLLAWPLVEITICLERESHFKSKRQSAAPQRFLGKGERET